jgi:thiol-disulfide isomerase/thioredoxin
MKKIILLFSCLAFTLTAFTQKASVINGTADAKFYKEVVLYKVVNGRPVEIASAVPDSQNRFAFKFTPEYEGFYTLGTSNIIAFMNAYTFYFRGDEELNVNLLEGDYELVGKNSKENLMLTDLYRQLKPLEDKSVYRKGLSTYVDFFPQVEEINTQLEAVKKRKTVNPAFDQLFPTVVDFSMANIAVGFLFTPRTAHPSREEWTSYYSQFDADQFLTDDLLLFPYGDRMLNSLVFMKIPPQQKATLEETVTAIPSDLVKGQYVLKRMESVRSYVEYAELAKAYDGYLSLDDQKHRSQAVSIKLADTKPGGEAIPFTFPDVNGKDVSLASLKGKVVLVDLWATWCGPCKAEEPHWEKLVEDYMGKDVAFVGISIDRDKAAWEKYVPEKQLCSITCRDRQYPL